MIILPNSDPQSIRFRCRPHEEALSYLLLAWIDTDKIYPLIFEFAYIDGHLSGDVAMPIANGLENGAKITIRVFPILDEIAITEAIEALKPEPPYIGTVEQIATLIVNNITDLSLMPEIFRGQIFVSNRTEQPYNIT